MQGIWEILGHSFPLSLNIKTRKGGGQPLFWEGLEVSTFPNLQSFKRGEVLKPLIVQGFQIWKTPNFKGGESGGQKSLLGNLSFSHPSIPKVLRKGSVCKPHSIRLATSLLQFLMWSSDKLVGKPPSGNESISGQLSHLVTKLNPFLPLSFQTSESLGIQMA